VHPHCLEKIESDPHPQPEIELSVQTRESVVTSPDRRQTPRTKLAEIAYIGMGPENGGLVLDVSDGGLSFHAVAPVQPADTIRFLLSLRGHSRIEGAGEVVWTNEMRTVCGLRFTALSSGAREHLNNWTNQTRRPAAAREEAASPAPPAPPQTEEPPVFLASHSAIHTGPVFAIPPAPEFYLSETAASTLWQGPLFFWVMLGFLGAALSVTGYIYGIHVGKSQISPVAQSAAIPAGQTEPPILAPTPLPASSVATDAPSVPPDVPEVPSNAPSVASNVRSVPNVAASVPSGVFVNASKTDDTSRSTVKRSGADGHAAVASDQQAEQALAAGKSELAAALAYLNGDNGQRDSSRAVQQLWAAVENGNSAAEVILSDLYLSGDGVAKNCEQGRVLLMAATKRGDARAKVKLDELNANGCP
jgi:PilZ domain